MEARWLTNFAVDLWLLLLACRGLCRARAGPLLLAASLGACLSCLPIQGRLPVRLALSGLWLLPMALLASGGRRVFFYYFRFLFCALFSGGAAALLFQAFGGWTGRCLLLLFPASALCLAFIPGLAGPARQAQLTLVLSARGQCARFPALLDTGNCLREPISGLPVLVAERSLVASLLPPDCGASPLPPGFRLVRYGGVGGAGVMPCFRPDHAYALERGRRRGLPDMWVAVYPGRLPGPFHALAPGCCAPSSRFPTFCRR